MAFAKLASAPVVTQTPVTLVYAREEDAELSVLDARLATIVDRYKPYVVLKTVGPEELKSGEFAYLDCPIPAVVVLRGDEVVGQALGAMLPHRELENVVRCAVEWPAATD
jgi:hypothetical protein